MEVSVWLCVTVLQFHALHGLPITSDREVSTETTGQDRYEVWIEERNVQPENSPRQPRRIIKKIQAGVAFLAGVKVGSLLASKGFDLGQGSIATSNNFQIFGKPVSSAISLAYGGSSNKLPLLDEPILTNETDSKRTTAKDRVEEDVVHVTVVRNPSPDTIDKLRKISKVTVAETNETVYTAGDDLVVVESNGPFVTSSPDHSTFIQQHNKRVMELNNEQRRRNSKF